MIKEINLFELQYIMKEKFIYLKQVKNNVICKYCQNIVLITDESYFIDDNYNIVIDGKCKFCKSHIERVLESNLDIDALERTKIVIEKDILKDKT